MCFGLKKIMKFQKGKPRWNVENLYIVRLKAENFVGGNLFCIGCGIGNVKEQRNVIFKFVLDTVIVLVGKVERRLRERGGTQRVINKG